jgi:hypothetical protein
MTLMGVKQEVYDYESMILHLLIIKYFNDNDSFTKKNEEGVVEDVNEDAITNFLKKDEFFKLLKSFDNFETFYNRTDSSAKKNKGKYDLFNRIFFIKARNDDTRRFKDNEGNYYFIDPVYSQFDDSPIRYYNIVYLNAYKNCADGYSLAKFDNEIYLFKRLIHDIFYIFYQTGINLNFTNPKIIEAINNTTIFENKKINGKVRDIKDCTNPHTTEIGNYITIANKLKDIFEKNKKITEVQDLAQGPPGEVSKENNSGSGYIDIIEGGRFTKKRKIKKRKTKKRKTKRRKTRY